MYVFISENSRYAIRDRNLIINGDENLGGRFVYISDKELISILRKYKIPVKKGATLDKKIGDEILAALENEDMDPQKIGGRYFALIEKNGQDVYSIFCSSPIKEIKDEEGSGLELQLSDDNALK